MSEFYQEQPHNFHAKVEVSTVFLECEEKLLLLQLSENKLFSGKWAVPGGKLEAQETPLEGLIREIWEELHLHSNPCDLDYQCSFYVRHPLMDYKLHLFRWKVSSFPQIKIDGIEHQAYCWQPIEELNKLPLIEGQLEAFHFIYSYLKKH